MRSLGWTVGSSFLVAVLAACSGGAGTSQTGSDATDLGAGDGADTDAPDANDLVEAVGFDSSPDGTCPAGTAGCACLAGGTCNDGAACESGTCARPSCPAGSDGCPCTAKGECGVTSYGEALTCKDSVCSADSCPAGQTGCACKDAYACTTAGDSCQGGFCRPVECPSGQQHCACAGGGCASGLTCRDGAICVDGTGWVGGPCFSDGTCKKGSRCQGGQCLPCTLGSTACACRDDATCYPGLACSNGLCAYASTVVTPPTDAPCYTPCSSDLVLSDGTYKKCGADRLLDGCVGGLVCKNGSCTKSGDTPPACVQDIECPNFQTCLAGHCYSNCKTNGDCTGGRVCHLHVCRQPCDMSGSAPCPSGYSCETADGVLGACTPVKSPAATAQTSVNGGFALDVTSFALSNVKTGGQVVITNNSPTAAKFTLRKRGHSRYKADGTVDSADDPANDGVDCDPAKDCPLTWLKVGSNGNNQAVQSLVVNVDGNGGTSLLTFEGAGDAGVPRWAGSLEVIQATLGSRTVSLEYVERPDGRWEGTIQYFANFGDEGLSDWASTPDTKKNPTLLAKVGNALVQRWGAFRTGNLSWAEFQAVLQSVQTQSWRWPSVTADCKVQGGACYPYDNSALGLSVLTSDLLSRPVPTGISELPFAANLYFPDPTGKPAHLEGMIDGSYALQYPGDPAVSADLGGDPSQCQAKSGPTCLVFVNSMHADMFLGGRYATTSSDTQCSVRPGAGYRLVKTPWLVPGFTSGTEVDAGSGLRYQYECRDARLPRGDGPTVEPTQAVADANLSLVPANPVPDARTRRRSIDIVDGALVDQRYLFLIFHETYPSFLPGDTTPFSAYGYVLLQRQPDDLDLADDDGDGVPNAYDGSHPADARTEPAGILDAKCSPAVVKQALGPGTTTVTADNAAKLAVALIDGRVPTGTPALITSGSGESVHYLCADTGQFDGGPGAATDPGQPFSGTQDDSCGLSDPAKNHYGSNGVCDDGGPGAATSICPLGRDKTDCGTRKQSDLDPRVACPAGSDVTFFTLDSTMTQKDVAGLSCQIATPKPTCAGTLRGWRTAPDSHLVQYQPAWRCQDANAVFCDSNRYDLRDGKLFYAATDAQAVFAPLYADIDLAFRYKTKFRGREGTGIGFAPQVCVPGSDQVPYCYDPPAIQNDRDRVDCLLNIWAHHYDDVQSGSVAGTDARKMLTDYLCTNYAYAEACHPGMPAGITHDGFERLFTELLVMMGDESYTRAFSARFDLAGSQGASFEGTLFESGGINLSGAAGYEMHLLYLAAQYYQEALDRFDAMSPLIWQALQYGFDGRNFVTQKTVTWYFERLVRASTQKSRAWSEIAKRYQNLDRPDLARAVVERAYTATYLEGVLLSQFMRRITDSLKPEDRPQVSAVLEDGQKRYHTALLDMRRTFQSITDNISYFGLPPDYVPFPVTFGLEQNAFELILSRAQQRVETAKYKEDLAIERSTSFQTETADFQSELVKLRNTYEDQIGQVCGTFTGLDGKVYPAIPRYAYLNDRAKALGDPCGLMGNGSIFDTMGQFDQFGIGLKKVRQQMFDVYSEVGIEKSRVEAQCNLVFTIADFVYSQGEKNLNLQEDIDDMRLAVDVIDRFEGIVSTTAGLMAGGGAFGGWAAVAFIAQDAALNAAAATLNGFIAKKQQEIARTDLDTARWQTESQCDAALIDSNARTAGLLLQTKQLQLDALQAEHQIQIAMGDLQGLRNLSRRLQDQLAEAEQMAIDVQAAHDDPNVRIYKDDAIENADATFTDALQEVYRATRVFEYYSSQSYADLEKLFLVRSVQYGDYNLESYLRDIEDAYYSFEEVYGMPSTRVAILSLRDDIVKVPRLDGTGAAIAQSARIDMLRERLRDPSLLDQNGYLTVPFETTLADLSPVTRDHKIAYVQAEIIGSNVGDTLGRIYLRQTGTSTVYSVSGSKIYYRFPERLAVVNPFFNGNRVFTDDVYRNSDFRDRPYLNSSWELVINQRDEGVNQDIDLQSVTDVRVYVYYSDFVSY